MVRYHANDRGRPDIFGNDYSQDIPGNYDYYAVEGDEIHEVAVGPVHAGVIEPAISGSIVSASGCCTWKFNWVISTAASRSYF